MNVMHWRALAPAALFFVGFLCLATGPIEEGDLFWHLRMGQWYWEHGVPPDGDPFSYTYVASPSPEEESLIRFIHRQYWLGQLTLYGLWEAAGSAGIVMLRALAYTGVLLFLFWWMRRAAGGFVALIAVFLTGTLIMNFPSERPQLFSFLFTPAAVFLLEGVRVGGKRMRRTASVCLPLLMLLWANIHAGFLLGTGIIGIYLLAHLVRSALGRERFRPAQAAVFVFAALATAVNRNGVMAFLQILRHLSPERQSNLEYLSPLRVALELGYYLPSYWLYALAAAAILVAAFRRMNLAHLLTVLLLLVLSLRSLRFAPYFLLVSPLLACYVEHRHVSRIYRTALTVMLVVWLALSPWERAFSFDPARVFPAGAVAFMQRARPAPRIFNYYDWGGYIMKFLPRYRVFIDGRNLVRHVSEAYDSILGGADWAVNLYAYGVNTVVMPGMSHHSGRIYPLLGHLVANEDWHLVYADDVSVVFVKDVPGNASVIARHALGERRAYEHLVSFSGWLIEERPRFAPFWLARAEAYASLGDSEAAEHDARRALELGGDENRARSVLERVGAHAP